MSSIPVAYSINHDGLILDISLVETDKLLIHEEIIPYQFNRLKEGIARDGVQSAPVLVDRNTLVVLDGMHRTAVMRSLGCRFTCVCQLDYMDPRISVHRWCRLIPAPFDVNNAKRLFEEIGLKLDPSEMVEDFDEENQLFLVFKDNIYRVASNDFDLLELFKRSYALEKRLQELGYRVEHCNESEAVEQLSSGRFEAFLCPPKVEKINVLTVARSRKVFTPKATRHNLPARPVCVNVPLSLLLNRDLSREEANKILSEILHRKKLEKFNPGVKWMDRTYDEVLYVFSDP